MRSRQSLSRFMVVLVLEAAFCLATQAQGLPFDVTWQGVNPPIPHGGQWMAECTLNGKIYLFGGLSSTAAESSVTLGATKIYDPATQTWTMGADMPTARYLATAVAVDGKIYVMGGRTINSVGSGGPVKSNEVYDPATDAWTTLSDMPSAIRGHAACAYDGKIYVFGGNTGSYQTTVHIYDPAADSWSTGASMQSARAYGVAFYVASASRIYYIGGDNGGSTSAKYYDTAITYDPAADSWDSGSINMIEGVSSPGAAFDEANGLIYVFSGTDWDTTNNQDYGESLTYQVLDTASNTFTQLDTLPPSPIGRADSAGAFVDGKVYVFGGDVAFSLNDVYDTATDTWYQPNAPLGYYAASQNSHFLEMGNVVGMNNTLYVLNGAGASIFDGVYSYDPASNTWSSSSTSNPVPRYGAVADAWNVKIAMADGYGSNDLTGDAEVYDPSADTFTSMTADPSPTVFAAGGVVNGKLYVFGGYDGNNNVVTARALDMTADSWSTLADMPTKLDEACGVAYNGKIYLFGGIIDRGTSSMNTSVIIYDPATDTYSNGADMPAAVYGASAAVYGDYIIVYGGDNLHQQLGQMYSRNAPFLQVYDPATDTWSSAGGLYERYNFGMAVMNSTLYATSGEDNTYLEDRLDIATLGSGCTVPGVPTIGTVTVPGTNQLQISWTAGSPAGATYNIYRSTGACPGGTYTQIATGVSASPFTDNTVSGGITYAYRVTAIDSTGECESAQSGCVSGTATGSCITPPTFAGLQSVTMPNNATCELDLSWNAATANCGGPVTYNVYRSTTTGFTPGAGNAIATGVKTVSYTDINALSNGTPYYYVVRAVDASNGIGDANTVEKNGTPTGPITISDWVDDGETGGKFIGTGLWHLADNSSCVTPGYQSPTHAYYYGQDAECNYDTGAANSGSLTSPVLNGLSATSNLTFQSYLQTENFYGYDNAKVEISVDGGTTWTTLDQDVANGGTIPNSGGSWSLRTISLAAYAGENGIIRFNFNTVDPVANSFTGWFLDDVTVTNISIPGTCVSACTLTCTASASPASGTAPLDVSFTAASTPTNCTETPTYDWDFGDGTAHSSAQNPTHTYASAGTYTWVMTAAVNDQLCTKTGRITVNPPCTLACTASATPESGYAPLDVSFTATATPSNCTGTPIYNWNFGDGIAHSCKQNPTHTYSNEGTYTWTLAVSADDEVCTKSGTITVSAPPCNITVTSPMSASAWSVGATCPTIVSWTSSQCGNLVKIDLYKGGNFVETIADSAPNTGSYSYVVPQGLSTGADYTVRVQDLTSSVYGDSAAFSLVTPPVVGTIKKGHAPSIPATWRLKIQGANFDPNCLVYIGNDTAVWSNVKWKNSGKILLKKGRKLKAKFPEGVCMSIRIVNPDGGEVCTGFQRGKGGGVCTP